VGEHATEDLLRLLGYAVEVIPSGCCGMSGAFGYEAEHYDVSMQVGELLLLPAARELAAKQVSLAASGVSCRAQISDGAGLEARHPVVLARNAVLGLRAAD
jgi:Fe-S oxidoreductase